jgi:eukaryotic-like serine/threonine-protein kinase
MPSDPTKFGPYRLYFSLGEGGMGIVHRATHMGSGESVALKTVKGLDPALHDALRREIAILMRIEHPRIVRVLDSGEHEGVPYYTMAVVEGQSLREVMDERLASQTTGEPAFEVKEIVQLGYGIASALAFAHGHGVVHRDIKPGNIMVTDQGPVLIDFGLATLEGSGGREALHDEASSGMSLPYVAPERLTGGWVDGRSDLYSLGCLLYELLASDRPFNQRGPRLLMAHVQQKPVSLVERVPHIPPALSALVMGMLEKKPSARPSQADAVAYALRKLGADVGPQPLAPPVLYRPGFVGQSHAWGQLTGWLEQASEGRGGVRGLRGASGAGKTRLMLEAANRASGTVVLTTAPNQGVRPLSSLRAALSEVASCCSTEADTRVCFGHHARLLALYAPVIATLPGYDDSPESPILSGPGARLRLYTAIAAALTWAANHQRLVLFVDDIHWTDQLSLGFFDWCIHGRIFDTTALLLVLAWRGEEQGQPISDLLASGLEVVDLQPMTTGDVGAMVADMLAITPPPMPLATALADKCVGNPFLVGAYLRMALAERALIREHGAWRVQGSTHAGVDELATQLNMPATVAEMVERRLATLSDAARHVIRIAAVLGKQPDPAVLQTVSGADDKPFMDMVTEALIRGVLVETEGGKLAFAHDKLRESVLSEMPTVVRSSVHGSAVRAYEADPEHARRNAGVVATHAVGAEDHAKAVRYLDLAAEDAYVRLDYADAEEGWRHAANIVATRRIPDPAGLLRESGLADAYHQLGDLERLIEHGEAALAVAGHPMPNGKLGAAWQSLMELATLVWREWRGMRVGPVDQEKLRLVRVQNHLTETYSVAERVPDAMLSAMREINMAYQAGAEAELARALASGAIFGAMLPVTRVSKRWQRRAQALCDGRGGPSVAHARVRIAASQVSHLDWIDIDANIEDALRISEDEGATRTFAEACIVGSLGLLRRGRFGDARKLASRGIALDSAVQEPQSHGWCSFGVAGAQLSTGQHGQAAVVLDACRDWIMREGPTQDRAWGHALMSMAKWQAGMSDDAKGLAHDTLRLIQPEERIAYFVAPSIRMVAEVALLADDAELAKQALAALKSKAPYADGRLLYNVMTAIQRGDADAMRRARDAANAAQVPYDAGLCSFWLARGGHLAEAEAREVLNDTGMGYYLSQL